MSNANWTHIHVKCVELNQRSKKIRKHFYHLQILCNSPWKRKLNAITANVFVSSSIGTTAHCGLWPVEQCPSIFPCLPPTLSIFSLPALEDLLLLPLPIRSWVFPSSRPFQFLSEDFLGILSSSILSKWPNQFILCPFIHFTILSPLLISSSLSSLRLTLRTGASSLTLTYPLLLDSIHRHELERNAHRI